MSSMSGSSGMQGPMGREGTKIPKGYKQFQIQNFTPEMMELFKRGMEQLGPDSFLARLAAGDESLFAELEAPAHRQFAGKVGDIASRFSGQGMGARRSSGFQNTMTQAGSDFAQDLQAKRLGLQRDAIRDMQAFTNQLLNQKPYETGLVEKQQKQGGSWGGAASGAASGAAMGSSFGPWGAAIGGVAGGALGYFGGNSGGGGGGNITFTNNNKPNNSSPYQYPLTSEYDLGFRSGAMY